MGMKEIGPEEISVAEANAKVGKEFSAAQWEFLVRRMKYGEISFDRQSQKIHYPGYVPFHEFFQGVISELDEGSVDARPCAACQGVFDVNVDEGVFARPDAFERFVCKQCAQRLSAWDFFHDHMT